MRIIQLVLVFFLQSVFFLHVAHAEYEKINVQLKWMHDFQFAGFYMALEQGYYHDVGLDVKLIEGGVGKSSIDSVLSQENTYGVTSTGAMLEHSRGRPIQAVGVIFQYSPLMLMVRKDSGIRTIEDLRGKRIMLQKGYQNAGIIAALQTVGITEKDFIRQDISYNLNDLIEGKTDAYAVYAVDQPELLKEQGIDYRLFNPKEQGIELYGDIVVVHDDEVANHAERIRAFMEATSRGWQYAFSHVDEAIDLILNQYNTQHLTRKHLQFEASEAVKFVLPDVVKPGYMNISRWQRIAQIYQGLGFLPERYQVESFVYIPHYTWSAFFQKYLWQILFILMLIVSVVLGFSVFAAYRLVKKKTKALVESESSYRTLLEMLNVGVVVHKHGKILYANPYAIDCFQQTSMEHVYGKKVMDYVHPSDQANVFYRLKDLVEQGDSDYVWSPVRYIGKQGKEIRAKVCSIPFKFHDSPSILTIIQDEIEFTQASS